MRKLLALVLVLVLASTSFGALATFKVIKINDIPYIGSPVVMPSDIVTIAVVADFASNSLKLWHIDDNVNGGTVQAPYWTNPGYNLGTPVAGNGANMNGMLFAPTATTNVNAFQGAVSGSVPAGVLCAFDYHVPLELPSGATITISVIGYNTATGVRGTDTVWVPVAPVSLFTPEPMTMSLLGLGGLGLLRRRG